MNIVMYSDGGSRGNPGPSGIGIVIKNDDGKTLDHLWKYIGLGTNNRAEYTAVKEGLEYILQKETEEPIEHITCFLDSELVVKQLNGEYRVKNPDLQELFSDIRNLVMFRPITFIHIPREHNQEADALANKAMDTKEDGCITFS